VTFLLDVNILIALVDPLHISHDTAHRWFADEGGARWATCPITENGLIRIVGRNAYTNVPASPDAIAKVLAGLCAEPGHEFWPDDISLLDPRYVDPAKLLKPGQITDTYLLALAMAHGGMLATLDRRLSTTAVRGGAASLRIIQP
jgi:toxin-antitoxin system PIN domain toxin